MAGNSATRIDVSRVRWSVAVTCTKKIVPARQRNIVGQPTIRVTRSPVLSTYMLLLLRVSLLYLFLLHGTLLLKRERLYKGTEHGTLRPTSKLSKHPFRSAIHYTNLVVHYLKNFIFVVDDFTKKSL